MKAQRTRIWQIAVFLMTILVCSALSVSAEQKKEKVTKHTVTPNEVVGEVTGFSQHRFISVCYSLDKNAGSEEEILLPIDDKNIKFDHVSDLSGLAVGDIVRIQYDNEYTEYDSGRKQSGLRTKVIGFVKKGQPRKLPVEPVIPEGILKSEEE